MEAIISEKSETITPIFLPKKTHQIILGSLLGDMYCKKDFLNSNIEETHSIKQKEYLTWKYLNLKDHLSLRLYTFNNILCKAKNKLYFRQIEIRLRSKVSEKLNTYHNLFYVNGIKTITQTILSQLDTLGLAVWYCDDGYYDPENKIAEIHTEGFSMKENQLLKKWFKEKWDINAAFKKDPSKNKILLRFPVKETDKFLNLIKEDMFNIPNSIWYKLGHVWIGNKDILKNAKLNKSRRTKLYQSKEEVKIRRNQQAKDFYYRNKEKILKDKTEYRKTEKYKDYIKKYFSRQEVRDRIREYQKIYRRTPQYKKKALIYKMEYRKRPEVKEKIRQYNKNVRELNKLGGKN